MHCWPDGQLPVPPTRYVLHAGIAVALNSSDAGVVRHALITPESTEELTQAVPPLDGVSDAVRATQHTSPVGHGSTLGPPLTDVTAIWSLPHADVHCDELLFNRDAIQ